MATAEAPVSPEAAAPAVPPTTKPAPTRFIDLSVKDIVTKAGDNVRSGELPDIEKLAESIAAEGVLEPILVTPSQDTSGKYTVVAGHRRLTAVRSLGQGSIPALVIDADADRRLKLALIENIHREDMSPLDKARGLAKLIKSTKLEQHVVASAIGVAPGYVSQYLALLELPESALSALRDGEISFTQARSLCRLLPDTKAIDDLVFEASNLTVAALDAKVSHLAAQAEKAKEEAAEEDEDGEEKPKKAKKAKPSAPDRALEYYTEAEFHPLKKEDIRELMLQYKRKELNADTAKKREEYRLILKGITMAADLRLK
jgi:ParB family chromosome partitioning protein